MQDWKFAFIYAFKIETVFSFIWKFIIEGISFERRIPFAIFNFEIVISFVDFNDVTICRPLILKISLNADLATACIRRRRQPTISLLWHISPLLPHLKSLEDAADEIQLIFDVKVIKVITRRPSVQKRGQPLFGFQISQE